MENIKTLEEFSIIVDRVEGEYAVCEFPDSSMRDIKLSEIPFNVKERNILIVKFTTLGDLEILRIKKVDKIIKTKKRPVKLIRFT